MKGLNIEEIEAKNGSLNLEKGGIRKIYGALGSSSCPGGGNRGDQWPVLSLESRIQWCKSLSLGFPYPISISECCFLLAVKSL